METPLFFKNKNYNLFGIIHDPDSRNLSLSRHKLGIVFCHPFAEEKLIAHRVMVNFARSLTKEGIYCLRFDYMGHGESDGNFEDSTVETRLSDIQSAIDFLVKRSGIERICLIGVRFGATMAALACSANAKIKSLVLISPIIEGKSYIDQCLRSNLTTQMTIYKKINKDRKQLISELMADQTVNIDGYLLTKTLYQQIEAINLLNGSLISPENVLLLQISKNEKQPIDKGIEKLYMKYKAESDKTELSNIKEDYFWTDTKIYAPQKRSLHEAVLKWLQKVYSP